MNKTGHEMYQWLKELFPICRSLTGNGVRETLAYINKLVSGKLNIHEIRTGTKVFDWTIPKEWNIRDAYIKDESGKKVVDFQSSNLHVVGYSIPVDKVMPLEELEKHLYSLPEAPDAIPYVTSYYEERWGFCLSEKERRKLKPGNYHVFIDSSLKKGSLTYGELILPGSSKKEILLSTYICHPQMANNELSGPVVQTALAQWLMALPKRRYTYRIIFIPETIGSIAYLSRNLKTMKRNTIAGFVITCVGDNRAYSLLRSRYGKTLADKVAVNILKHHSPNYKEYPFLKRGSDERQYCSPGVDLPVVSIMRTKYGEYPEYHTSLDNVDLVSPEGLGGSFEVLRKCCETLEKNKYYTINCLCEPQLGKRGLYPTISTKNSSASVRKMMNFIAYADGTNDLLDISNLIDVPVWELYPVADKLLEAGLISSLPVIARSRRRRSNL